MFLAGVHKLRTIHVFTVDGLIAAMDGHEGVIHQLRISPDNSKVASCSEDATVRVWAVATGAQLMVLRLQYPLTHIDFNQDGTKIVAVSRDNRGTYDAMTFRVWCLESQHVLTEFVTGAGHYSFFWCSLIVHLSQNELCQGAYRQKSSLEYWNSESGEKERCAEFPAASRVGDRSKMHVQPSINMLAVSTYNDTIEVWDINLTSMRNAVRIPDRILNNIRISPDGEYLAVDAEMQSETFVDVYRIATGERTYAFGGIELFGRGMTFDLQRHVLFVALATEHLNFTGVVHYVNGYDLLTGKLVYEGEGIGGDIQASHAGVVLL
jgi:WD40 repeat protein